MQAVENSSAESKIVYLTASEIDFKGIASEVAKVWRTHVSTGLVVGLKGPLGAGKTTWVRGMLGGLGYHDKVPSPTYALLEHYDLSELTVVHLDLYRLPNNDGSNRESTDEFEALGVRDWLASDRAWLLAEWPDRSPQLVNRSDIWIEFEFLDAEKRRVTLMPRSVTGKVALNGLQRNSSFNSRFHD